MSELPPMLTQEQSVEIEVLKRGGVETRAIARELRISRVTGGGIRRHQDSGGAGQGLRDRRS